MKRDEFIKTLTSWDGAMRGDAVHKQIVDAYNSYLPHPRGYKLTYTDDYCAAMVSAATREVKKMQEFLNACGYELDADGSFGPATQKAWGEYVSAWITAVTGK